MNIYIFIIGIIIGFFVATFCAGKKSEQQGRFKSLIFTYKKHIIHIHHWIRGTAILAILLVCNYHGGLLLGFLTGIIIQGLTYKNFYKIIYKK